MATNTVSRRYARALLDIAVAKGAVERYGQELAAFADGFAEHLPVIASPTFKKDAKRAAVAKAAERAGAGADVTNLLKLLVDKGRLGALQGIAVAYRELADETSGRVTARVISARPLDDAQLGQLRVRLTKRLGKNVTIETEIDPKLIGGIRTRVGSLIIDGTLAGHLERFTGNLRKG